MMMDSMRRRSPELDVAGGASYLRIADELERLITGEKWKLGQKLPSTKEIAGMFDVTTPTVQRSLSRLVRRGFLKRTRRKGTFVTYGNPVEGKIAIVLGRDPLKIESPYYSLLLDMIRRIASSRDLPVKYYLDIDEADYGRTIRELEADITSGEVTTIVQASDCVMLAEWLASSQVPVHFVKLPALDFRESVRLGLDYLRKRGFRKIVFVSMTSKRRPDDLREMEGLRDALARGSGACELPFFIRGGDTPRDGYRIMLDLLAARQSSERPDALFIHHDVMTMGALQALAEEGLKIPRDIALLTHSNKGVEFLSRVPLTRVEFDPAVVASRLLDHLSLKGADCPDITAANPVKPRLIIGNSCGE